MQLQKQLSRKVKGKEYTKWVIVIPPEVVREANLKEGQEFTIKVKEGRVILEKN